VIATRENNAELSDKESAGDPPSDFQVISYSDLLQFLEIPATGKATPSDVGGSEGGTTRCPAFGQSRALIT
jgi:hypothetical protein